MDIFQELVVKGSPGGLSSFVGHLKLPGDSGWSRRPDLEKELSAMSPGEPESPCFSVPERGGRPAAYLWLAFRDGHPDEMYVPNVVPCDSALRLSHEEYNAIVGEFFRVVAMPTAEKAHVSVALSKALFQVEDFVSPDTAKRLRSFSRLANRSTGSSHPNDQRRWFDFITAAHLEAASLDSHMLGRWLHEEEGWSDERATQLAIEYETGRALLAHHDNGRS